MDLSKLSKTELFAKCEEHGLSKYKSKNKKELVELLQNNVKPAVGEPELVNKVISSTSPPPSVAAATATATVEAIQQDIEINKIYNEDCIVGMRRIKADSADIVICDPPYNIGKDFGNDSDKQKMSDYLVWCDEWIKECLRILKPNGTLYIYGFSEILAFIRTRITCNVRWIIWHYTNKNTISNFWQRSHESILVCYKKKPVFNKDSVREPYTETFLKNAAGKVRKATKGRFSGENGKPTIHENGALPRDVIKGIPALAEGAGKVERVDHPTQKPLALCDKLIKASMNMNSPTLVILPFVGSGSECVSAKKNNIDFIGFELNPDYIIIANKRLEDKEEDDKNEEDKVEEDKAEEDI
jgi:site-specific DNA-methyltransferase (adenine-specific)